MVGLPASRVGDFHICPMFDGPKPHVGGPVLPPAAMTVITCMMPQARVGDMCTCVGPPDAIVTGAWTVLVVKKPAARILDSTVHGGMLLLGCFTVLIGGGGAGPPPSVQVGPNITIEGTPAFQQQTMLALAQIAQTPSGAKMLADMQAAGQPIKIVETSGGNEVTDFSAGAKRNADGTPGAGSGSTVHFNPGKGTVGDGSEPWMTRPPAIGLGHELAHATHAAHGELDFNKVQNDHKPDPGHPSGYNHYYAEEVRTAGIPPYDNEPYSENTLRSEWDPPQPQRPYY